MDLKMNDECNSIVDMQDSTYHKNLFASLLNNRFAIIKNHTINFSDIDQLYEDWKRFFSQKIVEKEKYLYSIDTDDGYVPFNFEHAKDSSIPDQKEFYQIHLESLTNNYNPCSIRTRIKFLEIARLGELLIKIIDDQLPDNVKRSMLTSLSESVDKSQRHCMRFIHYPPTNKHGNLYRSAPHDDICLLTIIIPTQGEGLILKKNSGWNVESANENSLIVFNSEMLEICTNGYFKSMTHHVTTDITDNACSISRYSMPFFVHPNPQILLKENLTAQSAVIQRIQENGLDSIINKFI